MLQPGISEKYTPEKIEKDRKVDIQKVRIPLRASICNAVTKRPPQCREATGLQLEFFDRLIEAPPSVRWALMDYHQIHRAVRSSAAARASVTVAVLL